MEGNTEAVKFLLEHGASTQVKDRFKSSPLDDAIKFRHKEIVKILRKAGAHLMKTSIETAVELCRLAAKNRVEDLHMWQLAGVDFNCCDYDKRTPLHVVSSTATGSNLCRRCDAQEKIENCNFHKSRETLQLLGSVKIVKLYIVICLPTKHLVVFKISF